MTLDLCAYTAKTSPRATNTIADLMPLTLNPECILLETPDVIAVNKPGGLATQAPSGIDSLEWRVKQHLQLASGQSGKVYLGVPHRLDRPATGVIVFAKNKRAARELAAQFQRREVGKKYWALVSGCVEPGLGEWSDWMRKIPSEARSEIVGQSDEQAQVAVLRYRVLGSSSDTSWLEINLETGRSHQIRLQASSRGYPVLGDHLYGSQVVFGPETEDLRQRWIALHARRLKLRHPGSREEIDLQAEPPAEFAARVEQCSRPETPMEKW